MRRRNCLALIVFLLLTAFTTASRGADVVQNVPHDTLGFIVVKNIGATDAKIAQLLRMFQSPLPGPLGFLQAATGIGEGLDPEGDFLLAALPAEGAARVPPKFAVWLPVRDYDRLIASLDAVPGEAITAITIAGEDVLVARHGEWALVMDPDQRQRTEQLLQAEPNPPEAANAWKEWIGDNDVAVVALRGGIGAILTWAAQTQPAFTPQPEPAEEPVDDPFDFGQAGGAPDPFVAAPPAPSDVASSVRLAIKKWVISSPRLTEWVLRTNAVGCALRLDEQGNALAGLRVNLVQREVPAAGDEQSEPPTSSLYQGGNFVLNGAGHLAAELTSYLAGASARAIVDGLKQQERMTLREGTVAQFQQAVERAAGEVSTAVVLTQPGDMHDGIYTNDFLVVRPRDAAAFAAHVAEAMRHWNTMNREATGGTPLVFDVEETKLGQRTATQFSLDVAAADGAPPLPEIRQAMEKFFGPGGKLRLWVVPVDEQTVLLARATPEQVSSALEVLDRKQPVEWSHEELRAANERLPPDAAWRLFFSPYAYYSWLQRQTDALVGGPVIGGPLVKEFPASPPVGLAGGMRRGELWIDSVLPQQTIHAAARYWHSAK